MQIKSPKREVIPSKHFDGVFYRPPKVSDVEDSGIIGSNPEEVNNVDFIVHMLNRLQVDEDGSPETHVYTSEEVRDWDLETLTAVQDDLMGFMDIAKKK